MPLKVGTYGPVVKAPVEAEERNARAMIEGVVLSDNFRAIKPKRTRKGQGFRVVQGLQGSYFPWFLATSRLCQMDK